MGKRTKAGKKWFEPKSKHNTDVPGQTRVPNKKKARERIDLDRLVAELGPDPLLRRPNKPITGQRAIFKIREVKSPYLGEFRGYRILVAMPNMCGLKPFSDKPAPSWHAPWFLFEFGDFDNVEPYLTKVLDYLELKGFARSDVECEESYIERKYVILGIE